MSIDHSFEKMLDSDAPEKIEDVEMSRIREDWSLLFFGSERGMRVFADMLRFVGFFTIRLPKAGEPNKLQDFREGAKWFVSLIMELAGYDTAEGFHRIMQIKAAAEHQEEQRRKQNG